MTQKHFIALANAIKNRRSLFTSDQLDVIMEFCQQQNSKFKPLIFINYINDKCGPKGGTK